MSGVVSQSNKRLNVENLDEYSKLATKEIETRLKELFTTLQKEELDPFGFGLKYRTMQLYEKDIFDKWKQAYPNLPFDLTVDVSLKSTGTIQ